MSSLIIETHSVEQTQAVGRRLGAALAPGDVIALVGPLGAGKTTLVKGVAEGAGVGDPRQVTSPTFIIVNEYEAGAPPPTGGQPDGSPSRAGQPDPVSTAPGLRIYHIDAYRLRGGSDLDALGFDEMSTLGAVLIEWADRVEEILPPDHLDVLLEPTGDFDRRLRCAAAGPRSAQLVGALGRGTGSLSP